MRKYWDRIWMSSLTTGKETAAMLRNIHFFNIKPGADAKRILTFLDHELVEYAKTFGCIERKTWKLLDARTGGRPVESAAYMNESLWPGQKEADAFTQAERPEEVKGWLDELFGGMETTKSVRYIDGEG
jgi:hypothetical protein